jgi:hypothetical protein
MPYQARLKQGEPRKRKKPGVPGDERVAYNHSGWGTRPDEDDLLRLIDNFKHVLE